MPHQSRPEDHPDPRHLRVGHAERDAVIDTLSTAAAEGRLTTDELTERIAAASEAKTYVQLDEIVADLPVSPPSVAVTGHVSPPPGAAGARHHAEPLVLRATWENVTRKGRWEPATVIRAEPVAATVLLNFLQVEKAPLRIDLDVTGGMGAVKLIVPADWGVNTDGLDKSWGTLRNESNAVAQAGKPQIVVTGSVGMASFSSRGPNKREQRALSAG